MEKEGFPELTIPITIGKIDIYRDGGSIGVRLIDAAGVKFEFCVDGRRGSNTIDRLYINAYYPKREGAKLISRGAKEENKIIELLQNYLDDKYSKEKQDRLRKSYGKRKLSEDERVAALSINAVDRIMKPRG